MAFRHIIHPGSACPTVISYHQPCSAPRICPRWVQKLL